MLSRRARRCPETVYPLHPCHTVRVESIGMYDTKYGFDSTMLLFFLRKGFLFPRALTCVVDFHTQDCLRTPLLARASLPIQHNTCKARPLTRLESCCEKMPLSISSIRRFESGQRGDVRILPFITCVLERVGYVAGLFTCGLATAIFCWYSTLASALLIYISV